MDHNQQVDHGEHDAFDRMIADEHDKEREVYYEICYDGLRVGWFAKVYDCYSDLLHHTKVHSSSERTPALASVRDAEAWCMDNNWNLTGERYSLGK